MLRLLARPRYGLLALLVVLVALGCVRLGIWQLDRYEARAARADAVRTQQDGTPTPLGQVLAGAGEPAAYTRVVALGRYDADATVLLRYRPQDGQTGWHVLTPLLTEDGRSLVVDRGFLPRPTGPGAGVQPSAPDPPPGTVEVVGWARASEEGLGYDAEGGTVRRVDVAELGDVLDVELLPWWLAAQDEEPAAAESLQSLAPPDTGLGPHLSYAVQWWLLGLVALVGLVVLLRRDAREEAVSARP